MDIQKELMEYHSIDAYSILGISPDSTSHDIRKAYETKKLSTTRKDVARVEKAYDLLKDKARRLRYDLLSPRSLASIHELAQALPARPHYCGPRKWFSVIKKD